MRIKGDYWLVSARQSTSITDLEFCVKVTLQAMQQNLVIDHEDRGWEMVRT